MKISNLFSPQLLGSLALALGLSVAGCQQGSGYTADQRDPIGPAEAGVPSPGIGSPGGTSVDTRSTGTIAGTEGEATLPNPADQVGTSRTGNGVR